MPPSRLRNLLVGLGVLFVGGLVGAGTVSVLAASPSPSASQSPLPTATPGQTGAPAGALPGDANKGQQIYNQSCTACHGASLSGGVGPKLNPLAKISGVPQYNKLSDPQAVDYLIATVANGKPGSDGYPDMPAKGGNNSLSDQDVKDVVAFIIQTNLSGKTTLSPTDLARSNVFWVTMGIGAMVLCTYLLARYNMRWIARRAAARRDNL